MLFLMRDAWHSSTSFDFFALLNVMCWQQWMAYDCYVAICNPHFYNIVMSPKMCSYLILGSYLVGFFDVIMHTGSLLRLTFCHRNIIKHHFCESVPLLELSWTSTYVNEMQLFIVAGKNIIVPTLLILCLMASFSQAFSKWAPQQADPKPSALVAPT